MSSPIRKMRSSRSISSRRASRRAARNSLSGIAIHLPLAGVEVPVELAGLRIGALVREADDVLDLRPHLVLHPLELLSGGDPRLLQVVLEAEHGVALAPRRLLLVGPVLVRVHDGVA